MWHSEDPREEAEPSSLLILPGHREALTCREAVSRQACTVTGLGQAFLSFCLRLLSETQKVDSGGPLLHACSSRWCSVGSTKAALSVSFFPSLLQRSVSPSSALSHPPAHALRHVIALLKCLDSNYGRINMRCQMI